MEARGGGKEGEEGEEEKEDFWPSLTLSDPA